MRSAIHLAALAVLTVHLFLLAWPPVANAQSRGIVVNGVALDDGSVAMLERAYRTRLVPGRYWYDHRSGLWGHELGPSQGQIAPGLRLPGPLHARASVGHRAGITRVFINGREIHPQELGYLRRLYGHVQPARYWLDARGIGGHRPLDLRAFLTRSAPYWKVAGRGRVSSAPGTGRRGCSRSAPRRRR